MLLACATLFAFAALTVNAQVYYTDTFDTFNENFWILEGTHFEINPNLKCLEGYRDAVVQQSVIVEDGDGHMIGDANFDIFTVQFDARAAEADADPENWLGIRLHDYQPFYTGEAASHDVYYFRYEANRCEYSLVYNDTVVGTYADPDEKGFTTDDWCHMGVKIEPGRISCYVDGKEVLSYDSPTLGQAKTLLMLWNNDCYAQFDNLVVGDLSLLPYSNSEDDTGRVTDDTGTIVETGFSTEDNTPETSVVTKVETDTDAEGNTVTKIVSEVVTVAPADTNTNGTAGGTGAQTGDMVAIVAAVMIVALGSAVIVKKIQC